MIDQSYKLVDSNGGSNTYAKEVLGIRTYLTFDRDGTIKVKKTQRVDVTLDINHEQRSNHRGFKGDMHHMARIPLLEWSTLMEKCGHQSGQGYDRKKLFSILNDSDYKNLKTVNGKI